MKTLVSIVPGSIGDPFTHLGNTRVLQNCRITEVLQKGDLTAAQARQLVGLTATASCGEGDEEKWLFTDGVESDAVLTTGPNGELNVNRPYESDKVGFTITK
mgnify:CR=1 FL=1